MFEVVGQDIISGMGFIGTDPDRLYRMGAAEKTEDVTVTGNPAVLDNATGKPFRGLHIYGRSEQMTTTGAQILELVDREPVTICGLTWQIKNQCISVNGTATDEGKVTDFYICGDKNVYEDADFSDGEITVSADLPKDIVMFVVKNDGAILTHIESNKNVGSFEHTSGSKYRILLRTAKNGAICDNVIKAMFNTGSTALPWEPYTGGKPSPSPEYPQEIVSAGEDGSIGVEVHGKNLLGGRFYYAQYSNGILYINRSQKDEEVKFPYQPRNETYGVCKVIKCQKGKNYVISVTNPNKNAVIGMAEYETIEKAIDVGNTLGFAKVDSNELTKSYTAKSDGILVCGIAGKWTNGTTTLHECTESELLQVEEASEATSYEPYHEPQSISVTTPNGLPGIPVSSGGNYTDETGQQWICDEVDFGRGMYVKRIGILILDDKSNIRSVSKYDNYHLDVVQPYRVDGVTMSAKKAICNKLPSDGMGEAWERDIEMIGGVLVGNGTNCHIDFYIKNQRLGTTKDTIPDDATTAVLKWLKDNPLSCKYALPTPIKTPLTASEIAAYKSLRTYRGTTIVEAEDKAGISVTYRRSAKTDNTSAERKIEESEKKEYDES